MPLRRVGALALDKIADSRKVQDPPNKGGQRPEAAAPHCDQYLSCHDVFTRNVSVSVEMLVLSKQVRTLIDTLVLY